LAKRNRKQTRFTSIFANWALGTKEITPPYFTKEKRSAMEFFEVKTLENVNPQDIEP
jgi:hypothetical protein